MKKYFLLSLFISMFFVISKAQTERGKVLLGGSIFHNYTRFQDYSNSAWNTDFKLGGFMAKNFVMGISTSLTSSKFNYDDVGSYKDQSSKSQMLSFAPFMRQYIKGDKSNVGLYFEEKAGFAKQSSSYQYTYTSYNNNYYYNSSYTNTYNGKIDANYFYYGLGAGLDFFLKKNVALEFGFNYNHYSLSSNTQTIPNPSTISNPSLRLNTPSKTFSESLGLVVFL